MLIIVPLTGNSIQIFSEVSIDPSIPGACFNLLVVLFKVYTLTANIPDTRAYQIRVLFVMC